jgi:hypothetical protein
LDLGDNTDYSPSWIEVLGTRLHILFPPVFAHSALLVGLYFEKMVCFLRKNKYWDLKQSYGLDLSAKTNFSLTNFEVLWASVDKYWTIQDTLILLWLLVFNPWKCCAAARKIMLESKTK